MLHFYLAEFKNRFSFVFIAWVSFVSSCFIYKELILFLFMKPFLSFFKEGSVYFIYTSITELVSTYMLLSLFLGNIVAAIFLVWHLLVFVTPGLFLHEDIKIKTFVLICFINGLFIFLTVSLIFFPLLNSFFLHFQDSFLNNKLNFYLEMKIYDYCSFYIKIYVICFSIFQFCIGLFFLIVVQKDNLNFLKNRRKVIYFSFLLFATLLTPPDIFCQCSFSFSFIIFFEILSIFYCFLKSLKS